MTFKVIFYDYFVIIYGESHKMAIVIKLWREVIFMIYRHLVGRYLAFKILILVYFCSKTGEQRLENVHFSKV